MSTEAGRLTGESDVEVVANDYRKIDIMVIGLRGVIDVQGGIETHARKLYPLLARMGCRVRILQRTPYFPPERRRSQWHGIELAYVWSPTRPGLETAVHSLLCVLYAAIVRPGVLHLHAIGPAFLSPLARLFGLRVVVTHHAADYRREKWGSLAKFMLRIGESLGMRFAHAPIVVSQVIGDEMKDRYGVSPTFIPNGAPRVRSAQTFDALRQFDLERGRYILCVARMDRTKRQYDLIEAFGRAGIAGWKLVLVGQVDQNDDYARSLLERSADDSSVVLTGFQQGKPLQELFSHCGLFVLPSSMEGHPIALLEALSYGVPVLASAIPENLAIPMPREWFFPLGDTAELAARLKAHAATVPDRQEIDRVSRVVRERYSWRRSAEQTLEVYKAVLTR